MKKKMSEEKKAKLIYSGELIIIAIVFLTIAILELTYVIDRTEKNHAWFNWLTIFGGSWMIIDFIWALVSPKRRKRVCLLDKILILPLSIYLITFDIYCFINILLENHMISKGTMCGWKQAEILLPSSLYIYK